MKPIDWTKVKSGDRFTARILSLKCEGEVHISDYKCIFLCQDTIKGHGCTNKHGYQFSWCIFDGNNYDLKLTSVENLKIISQNKTKPMAKKTATKKSRALKPATEKIKTLTGANWHIAQEKKGFSTKLVAKNGKVNRYDKGFNNRQNAMTNITSSVRNGFIDDGILIEAMIAAKTREDVIAAISAYGYLRPKRTELIAGVTVKNGKRVDAVKKVVKAKK